MHGGFGGGGYRGYGGYGGYGLGLGFGYGLGYGLGWGGYGGYGLGWGGYGYPWSGGYGYGYPGYGYDYGYANPYPYNGFLAPAYGAGTAYGMSATAPVVNTTTAIAAPSQRRFLGITEQPVVDTDGTRAMKVETVYSGSAADQSGLKPGDVIKSVNGFVTETPGNLAWIIANATPDRVLKMNVRSTTDGKVHVIAANLP
jgi:hypothetical protein